MTDEELNRLVAEKLMEWVPSRHPRSLPGEWQDKDSKPTSHVRADWDPAASTADAWEVKEVVKIWPYTQRQRFFQELSKLHRLDPYHCAAWLHQWTDPYHCVAWPDLLVRIEPRDISIAALRAKGIEV